MGSASGPVGRYSERRWIAAVGASGPEGRSGVVQEPGLELLISGNLELTLDKKDVITAWSFEGKYRDLCAELSD